MYTYKIGASKSNTTWGKAGYACTRIEITNTATGETKVCDEFTYLDDDTQEELEYLFKNNFEL